jgi:hypothetical protein
MRSIYCRIALYALITLIVEVILIWGLFTYSEADRLTIWFILAENLGMLLFPPYQGPSPTGLFSLMTGAVCWFLIVALIGETINRLRKEK